MQKEGSQHSRCGLYPQISSEPAGLRHAKPDVRVHQEGSPRYALTRSSLQPSELQAAMCAQLAACTASETD